jgi:alpha-ribazole phosphatase
MKLHLIRHAQSVGNVRPTIYGEIPDWQVPLTEDGKKQAENVADILKNIYKPYIYSSPYIRAKETAEIIAKPHGGIIYENSLIYERVWGNLRDEIKSYKNREERNHLFDFFRRPVGGESFADCYQRAFTFFLFLKSKYDSDSYLRSKDIIIVSHGEFLKLLLMIIDDKTVEEFENLENIKNCDIITRHL